MEVLMSKVIVSTIEMRIFSPDHLNKRKWQGLANHHGKKVVVEFEFLDKEFYNHQAKYGFNTNDIATIQFVIVDNQEFYAMNVMKFNEMVFSDQKSDDELIEAFESLKK